MLTGTFKSVIRLVSFGALLSLFAQAAVVNAQERVTRWVGGAPSSSSWGEAVNWDNAVPYTNSPSTHAVFGNSSRYLVSLGGSVRNARSLTFDGTSANNYTFDRAASRLVIHEGGITNERSGTVTFNNAIDFAPVAQRVSNQGGVVTFNGAVNATAGLTFQGSGTVVLAGTANNGISGGVNVDSGIVHLAKKGEAHALGESIVSLGGGRLLWDGSQQIAGTSQLVLSGGSAELQGNSQTFERLTIDSANQVVLDFGSDSESTLVFRDGIYVGGTLIVRNWSTAADWLMTSDPSEFLISAGNNLVFEGYGVGATAVAKGEAWQIVPNIPEPSGVQITISAVLVGIVAWRMRRRRC